MSFEQIGIIILVIAIFAILTKYSGSLKRLIKTFIFSGIIATVVYWFCDIIITMPPIALPIFMAALIVFSLIFNRDEE